jgi:hypothetical protein
MKNFFQIIFLLLLFAFGCGLPGRLANLTSNSGTAPSGGPSSGGDAAPPSGNPRNDVVTMSKKFLDVPKFSAKMDGRGTNELHMKLDYVAPDRFHMFFFDNNGQVKTESVMIGKDMYMRMGSRWQKFPGMVGDNKIINLRDMFNEEGLKNLKDVKYEGDDSVDGKPAHVYSYESDKTATNSMAPYPYTSKIWVGANDGLPKKIEVTYEGGDLKTMNIVYDYSSSISVEPPV